MAETSTKDLGAVTAYGEALEAGYTGTYEQFCDMLANFAKRADEVEKNLTSAQASAQAAAKSQQAAATSETNAASSVKSARSYSEGGTASRDGEDTDNAKYYMKRAQAAAEAASSGMKAATVTSIGAVKPDDESIKMKADGTIFTDVEARLNNQISETKKKITLSYTSVKEV